MSISPLVVLSKVANLKILHPTHVYVSVCTPNIALQNVEKYSAGRFAMLIEACFPPHAFGQGLFHHVFALQDHQLGQ